MAETAFLLKRIIWPGERTSGDDEWFRRLALGEIMLAGVPVEGLPEPTFVFFEGQSEGSTDRALRCVRNVCHWRNIATIQLREAVPITESELPNYGIELTPEG